MSGLTAPNREGSGSGIVRAATVVTAVFVVVIGLGVLDPRGALGVVTVAFSFVLFVTGSLLFLGAFYVAAGRSRDEQVTVAGVIWLTNAAPASVARRLRILLIIQAVVAMVAAGVRPFTAVAFGALTPMFGLGCIAFYGARHGTFAPIAAGVAPRARPVPPPPSPDVPDEVQASVRSDAVAAPGGADEERRDPDDFDQLFRRRRRK